MKQAIRLSALLVLVAGFTLTSCKKENIKQPESAVKKALVNRTWQIETVTQYAAGLPEVTYQRGAANNQDDYSLVRQKYKTNGTIEFTDQFGTTGSDGTYELLGNDTKIRIGWTSFGLSVTGENLKVNATEFAYTLKLNDGDSARYIFSPL